MQKNEKYLVDEEKSRIFAAEKTNYYGNYDSKPRDDGLYHQHSKGRSEAIQRSG